ncbi:alpha-L-fucosidase [Aquimarina macrocephali]|uniref:alpha-L-fucosidase n=1 Tax=Aquimarina macrocephali TaxID=666563 RepID=UPI000465EDF4|nr:alpha-L-fucosidase [Aquimarina macrocephali]
MKNTNPIHFLLLSTLMMVVSSIEIIAQEHHEEERYVPETDTIVLKKLEEWQNLKFGLLMHWGTYSQWGIVESWSLCPEEYEWCERKKGTNPNDYNVYKKEYEGLKKTFNPFNFDPEKWAKAAKNAGMKYVIFTTKHHDGFSMFDSKYTNYKITDSETPFSKNPKSNITKEIFDAFRKETFWTGAYFSKPDWHSPYYWDPYFPPKDRNVNYQPEVYPEKWNKFVAFTHNQILELLTDYGKIDILWLDGGWVSKSPKKDILNWYERKLQKEQNGYLKHRMVNQDIKMDELVIKARKKQPQLIVVDRAVHGKNQNYLTPENRVPKKPLPYPWESCIISGGGWSWTPDAKYMSGREAIHTLVNIVAKGGNLLLNIAPNAMGEWDEGAYILLEEIGEWMKINSEAIYDTRSISPYKFENICITSKKDGTVYLIYLIEEGRTEIPSKIMFSGYVPSDKAKLKLLGFDIPLKWIRKDNSMEINIPEKIKTQLLNTSAFVVKINK